MTDQPPNPPAFPTDEHNREAVSVTMRPCPRGCWMRCAAPEDCRVITDAMLIERNRK